jgi:hypothetical protein
MTLSDWAKANPDCSIHCLSSDQVIFSTDIDDAPLPFELYTEEELEEMQIEQEQDDWERSIPTPADRNPNLK